MVDLKYWITAYEIPPEEPRETEPVKGHDLDLKVHNFTGYILEFKSIMLH